MRILVVGGGSGGHITPAVAVVREILEIKPRAKIEFWTDGKYYKNVTKLTTEVGVKWEEGKEIRGADIRVRKVIAGKFRRYSGWKFQDYFKNWRVTVVDLIFKNIVGFFGVIFGVIQSFVRLLPKKTRPNVIFLKGGFVGLPVGTVAKWLKIPYVIHESDAAAGLANRILMKKATRVAFGVPISVDGHPNWEWTGTPVAEEFREVSEAKQRSYKKAFGFDPMRPLVVITGGSQGAQNINEMVRAVLPEMLRFTQVGLVAGRVHYEEMLDLKKYEEWDEARLKSRFRMWEFSTVMNELMGAADVVVARAGATTVAELASLKKAVILVPFLALPGEHQTKNAKRLEEIGATEVIIDDGDGKKAKELLEQTQKLVRSPKMRAELAEKLHAEAKPKAARRLAEIVVEVAK